MKFGKSILQFYYFLNCFAIFIIVPISPIEFSSIVPTELNINRDDNNNVIKKIL